MEDIRMAQNIISMYQKIKEKVDSLQRREKTINSQLFTMANNAKNDGNALQPTYQKEIAAIDEEISRLDIYVSGAKNHSILTSYKPVAEKVHPARLQQLYTMLSNSQSGRAAAIELQKKCANAKKYFEDEKTRLANELLNKTRALDNGATEGPEAKRLKNELNQIYQELNNLASGSEAKALLSEIISRSSAFFIKQGAYYRTQVPTKNPSVFCFGFAYFPFSIGDKYDTQLVNTFGKFYNATDKTILIPLCIPADGIKSDGLYRSTNITISYDDTTREKSHQILQGVLFNILRSYKPLHHRVTYIDMDTFNPEQLGYMRKYVGEDGLIAFPFNIDEAKTALNILQNEAAAEDEKKRERRYLIIRGIKSSGGGDVSETVRKICNNFQKNNIVTVFLDRQDDKHTSASWLNQLHIGINISSKNGIFITEQWGSPLRFGFLSTPGGLESTSEAIMLSHFQPKTYDNRYEAFFPLNKLPSYLTQTRKREKIVVPYGMDEKTGQVSYFKFEDMNFAAFLMGGSGSGKTTLIHAILAGIINTYHPDEVELWLADFKEAGFAPYENNMPPHVKYILMDSSQEMVCAFVDKLYEELVRRRSILDVDRLDVPVTRYMPAIFVVIDEFAAISETIKNRPKQQLRLTTLMTQGRSLGFRFIFSSQAFTTGAGALDPTAKGQIQARIAMAHQKVDEIKGVLELPTITEEAKNLINNLPAHYILYKNPLPNGYKLNRSLGLYFPGSGKDAWPSRYAMFERLKKNMKPVDEKDYDYTKPNQYVNKNPVVCGSAALTAFSPNLFKAEILSYRYDPAASLSDEDVVISFGQPRSLDKDIYTFITNSARENIFLLTNRDEMVCTMSVILSAIRSALTQKTKVQIWGHRTNQIYRNYKQSHFSKSNLTVADGKDAVCEAMVQLARKIHDRAKGNELIVLLGMEKIYEEIADDSGNTPFDSDVWARPSSLHIMSSGTQKSSVVSTVSSESEPVGKKIELDQSDIDMLNAIWEETEKGYLKASSLGKSRKEADEELDKKGVALLKKRFGEDADVSFLDEDGDLDVSAENLHQTISSSKNTASKRDYLQLFKDLLEHGCKNGYHFLLCIDDYNKLNDMGLKIKSFNHRLAFQTDSNDTSTWIFNSTQAATLAPHVCLYSGLGAANDRFLITPYLHKGVTWGDWTVDENGQAQNFTNI